MKKSSSSFEVQNPAQAKSQDLIDGVTFLRRDSFVEKDIEQHARKSLRLVEEQQTEVTSRQESNEEIEQQVTLLSVNIFHVESCKKLNSFKNIEKRISFFCNSHFNCL